MAETAPSPVARDQILDAGERLFAQQGFNATTIKAIGADAGLNPALLYYYFGSKEELYRAVLQRIVSSLVTTGGQVMDAATGPAEAIRSLIATQVEFMLGRPAIPKLFVREIIDHDARHAEAVILQMAAGLFRRLCEVIERGQRAGVFRKHLEPRFAAISTISQVVYFITYKPAVGIFLGQGPDGVTVETARAFGRHAGDFAVRALSAPEASE